MMRITTILFFVFLILFPPNNMSV